MQVENYIAAIYNGTKVVLIPPPAKPIPVYIKTKSTGGNHAKRIR